ncbi:MAG: caspase, EACC1-associated type [Aggregatilineales bacterium]
MSKRYALLIGISEYDDPALPDLVSPVYDVEVLETLLKNPDIGAFDEVITLKNASSMELRRNISNLFSHRKNKNSTDTLLLYFSGHGLLDGNHKLYFAAKDAEQDDARGTSLPASFVTECMDGARSQRQIIILDSCNSGNFSNVKSGEVGIEDIFQSNGNGCYVITASDAYQRAWEGKYFDDSIKHSFFTHFLIEGLKTGDADRDYNGKVDVVELFEYVEDKMQTYTREKQIPKQFSYRVSGKTYIARNPNKYVRVMAQARNLAKKGDKEGAEKLLIRLLRKVDDDALADRIKILLEEIRGVNPSPPPAPDLEELLADAKEAIEAKNYLYAEKLLSEVLGRTHKGNLSERAKEIVEEAKILLEEIKNPDDWMERWIASARVSLTIGDYAHAEKLLKEVLEAGGNTEQAEIAYFELRKVYAQKILKEVQDSHGREKYEVQLEQIRQAFEWDPDLNESSKDLEIARQALQIESIEQTRALVNLDMSDSLHRYKYSKENYIGNTSKIMKIYLFSIASILCLFFSWFLFLFPASILQDVRKGGETSDLNLERPRKGKYFIYMKGMIDVNFIALSALISVPGLYITFFPTYGSLHLRWLTTGLLFVIPLIWLTINYGDTWDRIYNRRGTYERTRFIAFLLSALAFSLAFWEHEMRYWRLFYWCYILFCTGISIWLRLLITPEKTNWKRFFPFIFTSSRQTIREILKGYFVFYIIIALLGAIVIYSETYQLSSIIELFGWAILLSILTIAMFGISVFAFRFLDSLSDFPSLLEVNPNAEPQYIPAYEKN